MTTRDADAPQEKPSSDKVESLDTLLRGALSANTEPAPDVLSGVQKRLRERSGGKFYADRWSTLRHAPVATYLITSLIMLAVLLACFAILYPLAGRPEPVRNVPVPVEVLPPQH